ncbi:hypothetical protein B0H14DRAFT_137546 [Mycena olivaceomarginata]|nr:hypothetical protein B0H14DRAFT_137546 [Mycena olivaceomarginata]
MKPDEGPYLPTSRACAHVRPHAVPAVVFSPLRAALDRSCPSSPHLRLLSTPPAASHLARPYSNIPHSLPFRLRICAARASIRSRPSPPPPASASACGTRPIRRQPHTRPLCPSFKHCVCRAAIGEGRGGGGVWNRFPLLVCSVQGRMCNGNEEEGGEYLRQVSGKYGTASTGVRGGCRGRCGAGRRVGGVQGGVRVWCMARI